jgi:hypothetical protein
MALQPGQHYYWASITTRHDDPLGVRTVLDFWVTGYIPATEQSTICAVVVAKSKGEAMRTLLDTFPDSEERFCNEREDDLYASLAASGRFPGSELKAEIGTKEHLVMHEDSRTIVHVHGDINIINNQDGVLLHKEK